MTWRQALLNAVGFLEEQGIYGQQAEYIAKEILRLGERIEKQSYSQSWEERQRKRDFR